jgi:hypothetical protein
MDHAQVGVRPGYTRIGGEYLPEGPLGIVQRARAQRRFSRRKELLRILRGRRRPFRRVCALRSHSRPQQKQDGNRQSSNRS